MNKRDKTNGIPRQKGSAKNKPRCGLCGRSSKLTRTDCCNQWICDDEDKYVPFSYSRNSCSRTHRLYTLCGNHNAEKHSGDWKDCQKCRDSFETEMYVWYGTNEHNFEVLANPPSYEPTRCSQCNRILVLSEGGYSELGNDYFCENCTDFG